MMIEFLLQFAKYEALNSEVSCEKGFAFLFLVYLTHNRPFIVS